MHTPDPSTAAEFRIQLDRCIHCGLCLPACPTYAVYQTEMEGPRGRIVLMSAAADGRIELTGAAGRHLDLCLGCRSCETACPSGVQYGRLLDTARSLQQVQRESGRLKRLAWRLALAELLPHRKRLRRLARALRVYQAVGLSAVARSLVPLPAHVRMLEALLPPLSLRYPDETRPAPAIGECRGKVAFFAGCVGDAFLAQANRATIRVLQRNGFEVHFPIRQTCCGAAAHHLGEHELACRLARQNVDAFASDEYTAVLSNAGGCGAALRDYPQLLRHDPAAATRAEDFSAVFSDITQFLASHLTARPTRPITARVTYADSCHLRHGQRVVEAPRQLLRTIPGITLVELRQPDACCGSAGVYNLLEVETAERVLEAKLEDIRSSGAEIVVTTNPGCQLQLLAGVRRKRLNVEVIHLIELLDRAYE